MAFLDFLPLIGTVANSLMGSSSNANLNAKNRHFQQRMSDIAYGRQQELMVNSPSLVKQGIIQAGLSPAAMQSYTGGASSVSTGPSAPSQLPEYVPSDFGSALQGLVLSANLSNTKANTRKTNADAEAQELENTKTKAEINEWKSQVSQHDAFFVDDDGVRHTVSDKDFDEAVDKYRAKHGELPTTTVIPSNILSEQQARVKQIMSDIDASIARNDNDVVQSKFAKQVALSKMADPEVMHAIYNMDLKQFETLSQTINKIKSDIDVNKSVEEYNKAQTKAARQSVLESVARTALIRSQDKSLSNSNLSNLVDSLVNAKDTKTGLVTLGKIILSVLFGNGSSGIASTLIR